MEARLLFLALCLMNAVWGMSYALTKWTLLHVPPATLAALRFFVGGGVLYLLVDRRAPPLTRRDWTDLLRIGFLGISVAFMFHYWGIQRTMATKAALAMALEPAFIVCLSLIVLKEHLHRRLILALGISFAGAAMVLIGDKPWATIVAEMTGGGEVFGDVLILFSVVLGSLYTILNKPVIARLGALRATAVGCLLGALFLLPLAVKENPGVVLLSLPWEVMLSIAFLSLVCTAFGYVLWNYVLGKISASEIAVSLNIQPLSGALMGMWAFGESLSGLGIIGAILILFGVSLSGEKS
jgi:drug/metabolite transporter (DMT)-like permease